ncbi:tail protein X [Pseudooceanicola sp. CBS1P-1]|uniref:Phage tail protein n=1 Tax=Pseudooceanicola albus TaxID=2692189 RepID=A0A6L7FXC0_9RHOB|nr:MULTISPECIES: tail protein X [Pseudooceanicola]MBT9383338.1 tail protein X [Pseudooceanicola endophyticus]MXN16339.1 phage tail protein [Pseudooceanicola albus]
MAVIYTTAEGDQLDLICYRQYGQQAGAVEQVLDANPAIALTAHWLPAGITLTLPDLTADDTTGTARLWD